jgi:hypothetical protein
MKRETGVQDIFVTAYSLSVDGTIIRFPGRATISWAGFLNDHASTRVQHWIARNGQWENQLFPAALSFAKAGESTFRLWRL